MRAFMWFMLFAFVCLSFVIGCYPSPAPSASQAQIQAFSELQRDCDKETSACCFHFKGGVGISCVHVQGATPSGRFEAPQVERGTRVLGQSLLGGPWESQ